MTCSGRKILATGRKECSLTIRLGSPGGVIQDCSEDDIVPATLTGGNFQNPLGVAITGTLVMLLNQDAHITAGGHAAPRAVTLTIVNGNISGSYSIYCSNELQPSGTYYVVTLIDSNSNLAYGPERWLLSAPGPIDIGTIVPWEDPVILANSLPAPTEVSLAPSNPGNFTVAHGLGRIL